MSAPGIRGWCPGALRPMLSGDGWVVRLRPPLGRLTPAQATGVAALAAEHGNGQITLSSRANVQIRGVRDDSHAPLIRALDALGLVDETAEAEARRNVLLTPFWREHDEAPHLAGLLGAALQRPDAPGLPGKFGFCVDTGTAPVLQGASADIRIERGASGGLICCADGSARGAPVTLETAAETALELARWFVASGGISNGRGRMAALVRRGAVLPEAFLAAERQRTQSPAPAPGSYDEGFLAGLAFGQMDGATLDALAGVGALRVTPWRMLLIEGARRAPPLAGLITTPDDPLLRVIACTGAPGCLQGLQPTRDLARALSPLVPPGSVLHVSGCAKACAHPEAAALTLVATPHGFDVIRDGKTTAIPIASGIAPDAACLSGFF